MRTVDTRNGFELASPARAAAFLRARRDVIVTRWMERVRGNADVDAAENLLAGELRDDVPRVLDRLADALEAGTSSASSAAREDHATARFAQGYAAHDVVRELAHLRATLIDAAAEEGILFDPRASRLLHLGIDGVVAKSIEQIARLERDAMEEHARAAREAQDRAETAARAKETFLATLSHELRTPLNAILGWSHLLRTLDGDQAERAVDAIERNAIAEARVVDAMIDMSRMVSGELRLDVDDVDVGALLGEALTSIASCARAKQVTLVRTGDASARTRGDATRLRQVLWNLLANAVKFSASGSEVRVALEDDRCEVRVRVTDAGEGIRPSFLPHVFDRFKQADSSATRPHGGLGLGLALVRELVELHGGVVVAESEGEGRGSTFVVTLPKPVCPET